MSEAENIAIVRRFYDEVFDRHNLDLADTLVAPHFKNHTAPLGAATQTHGPSLYRLLRAAAALGLLAEDHQRRFSLTAGGQLLRSDVPGSMRASAIMFSEPWYRGMWDKLLYSVGTGQAAFDQVHNAGLWEHLAQDGEAAASSTPRSPARHR